jgi:hypothetical protein
MYVVVDGKIFTNIDISKHQRMNTNKKKPSKCLRGLSRDGFTCKLSYHNDRVWNQVPDISGPNTAYSRPKVTARNANIVHAAGFREQTEGCLGQRGNWQQR